jgi:predicted nucleic acid-binding protein
MAYPTEIAGWKKVVPDKWILFDTDAIISILKFEQEYIFNELYKLGAKFVYIHPVLLELMNTDNPRQKLQRTKLLRDYRFLELPLHADEIKLAGQIQNSLPLKCQPSPTDLYLGGTLARHPHENCLLLTANIKDFPMPVYKRKGHILLQSDQNVKVLSLLVIDKAQLVAI